MLKQHPLRDFDTVGELKQWAWSHGFALSVKSSKPNRNVYLKSAKRTSSTRRTCCKYEVSGRFSTRTNLWSLCPRWIKNTHNHEPAPAISGFNTNATAFTKTFYLSCLNIHALNNHTNHYLYYHYLHLCLRYNSMAHQDHLFLLPILSLSINTGVLIDFLQRFDHKELEMIHNLSAVGAPPKQILSTLKKTREDINEPDTGAILKDVYNAKTKLVRAQRSGRTPLEHLYYELIRSDYLYESKKDCNNTLTHLFFAHPESIRLAQIYHHA
ncbi:hypothetical protein BY996DRAFT_6541634 [Phakopsora pachyrhizi]|nr:hypothetical protein BY996DRAFT_6541634 [Phakopsora pachyrhizi]